MQTENVCDSHVVILRHVRIVAIETPGGKRNRNININAQQAILKAYISNISYVLYSDYVMSF